MQWWCAAQDVDWSWAWRPYPGVWLFIAALAATYWVLRRAAGGEDGRRWVWMLGVLTLWIALDWPVGALGGGYLASLHMVQFLMIAYIASPLLLAGAPRGAFERLGGTRFGRTVLPTLTHPLAALFIFNLIVALTHLPAPTDWLMASQLGSFALDMIWLGAGLLFWWPVCAPVPERRWMAPPVKVGYLGVQIIAGTPIFAYIAFAELPLYAVYELAPRVHGISARSDQQAAGMLMKVVGMPIMIVASAIIFLRWSREAERDELEARERRRAVASRRSPVSRD